MKYYCKFERIEIFFKYHGCNSDHTCTLVCDHPWGDVVDVGGRRDGDDLTDGSPTLETWTVARCRRLILRRVV